jgi:6-methylsalicylate decarboxylase
MRVDVHQHFWSDAFVEALCRRDRVPFGRLEGTRMILHIAGEAPSTIDVAEERRERRAGLLARDGLDCALVAISSPIGVEALPRSEAQLLLDAYLDGVLELGDPFAAWGAIPLEGVGPADVDAVLGRGAVGVSLPAGALARPAMVEALGPLFERLAQRDAPLFVHPGPGLATRPAETAVSDPPWWPALSGYVSQMQAAWLSFAAAGRHAHPRLRIVFATLAGLGPLLYERLAARGGPAVDPREPLTFYETSSFGSATIAAFAAVAGEGSLLYGSDRPVVEPPPAPRALAERGAWLLAGGEGRSATMKQTSPTPGGSR